MTLEVMVYRTIVKRPISQKNYITSSILRNPKENVGLVANFSFTRNMTFVFLKSKLVNLWQSKYSFWQMQISVFLKSHNFPLAQKFG